MITAMIVAFVLLQVADGYTTQYALQHKLGREANVLVEWFIARGGYGALWALKAAGAALIAWVGWGFPLWVLAALNLGYLYVVINNVRVIRRGKGK